ncbi:hypothetical protein F4806DRAFT_497921 [Annulohypoxylon nitens]|nr:hypothetical protein F4806DRAFT_497921 [Annulohypoxylon nitens]
MCQIWAKKVMRCGHTQPYGQTERCDPYYLLRNNGLQCEVILHGIDDPRPYTYGDPKCLDCIDCKVQMSRRDCVDDYASFLTRFNMQDPGYAAVQRARMYLFSFDFMHVDHTTDIHQRLLAQYDADRTILDINAAITQFGYVVPLVPNSPQPQNTGILNQTVFRGSQAQTQGQANAQQLQQPTQAANQIMQNEEGFGWEESSDLEDESSEESTLEIGSDESSDDSEYSE